MVRLQELCTLDNVGVRAWELCSSSRTGAGAVLVVHELGPIPFTAPSHDIRVG